MILHDSHWRVGSSSLNSVEGGSSSLDSVDGGMRIFAMSGKGVLPKHYAVSLLQMVARQHSRKNKRIHSLWVYREESISYFKTLFLSYKIKQTCL